uniref:Chromosome 22 open reading frame 23 n=1 Tax=Nothobranchius korthausae TaxID=1143690 RepID=A0A1A8G4Z3_9TELE
METPSGGLWNNPRLSRSRKEALDMQRLRKEESVLTSQQREQTNHSKVEAASRPVTSSLLRESIQRHQPQTSRRRCAETCRLNYEQEKFCPGPTRDLEKEKRRLQSIFAVGKEESSSSESPRKTPVQEPEASEIDHFQEVLNEIEERRQFLADMAALGQEDRYADMIDTEITQRIRELDFIFLPNSVGDLYDPTDEGRGYGPGKTDKITGRWF